MMIRRHTIRIIKMVTLFTVVMFVWLQFLMAGFGHVTVSLLRGAGITNSGVSLLDYKDRSRETYATFLQQEQYQFNSSILLNGDSNNGSTLTNNLTEIRNHIRDMDTSLTIHNEDRFGPVTPNTVIFIIQVHQRLLYLQYLIHSLSQVKNIEDTLIIFSHDVYDPEINAAIQGVNFCKYLQIFYPYSIQLHPDSFPGQDPNDCPWDAKKAEAVKIKCNNAEHPDLYGHYREAKYAQIKHHWWWKLIVTFDRIPAFANHTGFLILLEEDHYVVEDLLHVLRALDQARTSHCPQCNVISLGTYLKNVNYASDAGRIEVWPWIASKHNMGMAIKRETWLDIRSCAQNFCNFDDYNWDWSLQYLSSTCLKNKLNAIMIKAPRVYHIGQCGVHHKKENCDVKAELVKVQHIISKAGLYLFPNKLTISRVMKKSIKPAKGNGGWGDVRDHWLCMHLLNTTIVE